MEICKAEEATAFTDRNEMTNLKAEETISYRNEREREAGMRGRMRGET